MKHSSVAILFHLTDWAADQATFPIADGISFKAMAGSQVQALYHKLCSEAGIDDAEPYEYHVYAELSPTHERHHFLDAGDPYSDVDRLCNIVSVVLGVPLSMTRTISSKDNFSSAQFTEALHVSAGQAEFLQSTFPPLSQAALTDIRAIWNNADVLWQEAKSLGRIANALTYFGYAWRSRYMDQVCLNLAVTLEILFAPHAQSETTHQIAYNVAHFSAGGREQREETYAFLKKFYGARSTIVHGGTRDEGQLIELVPRAFTLVAALLRRILTAPDLSRKFNAQLERQRLIRDLLFWAEIPDAAPPTG